MIAFIIAVDDELACQDGLLRDGNAKTKSESKGCDEPITKTGPSST